MIELLVIYGILFWYGIWWPFFVICVPLNIVQLLLNKRSTGQYFAKLKFVRRDA